MQDLTLILLQPIALIGHDGLERGGGRSDLASLPNNNSG